MKKSSEMADIFDNLYTVGRMFRAAEKKPRYYGTDMLLYPNEAYTLKAIAELPGVNQKELSFAMYRTKGATSVVVQKLIAKNLVVSKSESSDLRVGSLYPTEDGIAAYHAHRQYDIAYIDELIKKLNLSAQELSVANDAIEKIIEHFIDYNFATK